MNASKGGGLQMDGDEGEAQLFVRDVRCEELSLCDEERLGWVKACDDLIRGLHDREYHPLGKNFEAFIRTPKIGVLNDGLIIFPAAKTEKFQPNVACLGFKILTGDQHHTEAAFFQLLSDANKRVDITRTANGAEQDRFSWCHNNSLWSCFDRMEHAQYVSLASQYLYAR